MPHHVGACWSGAARHATAFALLVANGCTSEEATLVVIVTHGPARAVIASPIDPRTVRTTAVGDGRAGTVGKALGRYYAVADSADSLDRTFQHERDALNVEARKLAGADRRAPAYARDYDAYMSRVAVAARTREGRDRARRRAATLRAQLGTDSPDSARRHADPRVRLREALDSAAQANGRHVARGVLRDGRATLELAPGVWWIAIEHDGGLMSAPRRHEARRGARDTLRIGT